MQQQQQQHRLNNNSQLIASVDTSNFNPADLLSRSV